ncbi:MAG: pilus assembly protein TadG-related protein [Acidimicrobiales bacterium]
MGRARGEQGQVLPLVLIVVLVVVGAALAIVALGRRADDQARAQLSADAAALAGAADGRVAAEAIAAANHGVLVSFTADGPVVHVAVRVGDASAVASAERTDAGGDTAYSGADASGPTRRGLDAWGAP